ncbi:jg11695 [Pararge aegeria aegeria]|uniref:RNA helicase n=1 Tax=Pararge aegeria aegeria TaxID=348720 RepID=A0A8S4RZK5_9NEOP|nr:jg11695 [Pararge aegeria aegeria]
MSFNSSGGKGFGFAGFSMPKRNPSNVSLHAVPPPSTPMHAVPPPSGLSKQGYSTMNAITQNAVTGNWGTIGKKRAKTEDEYFDEEDEPPTPALAYIPAPGSPSYEASSSKAVDEDEDPLDAYMAGLEQQAAKDLKTSKENAETGKGDGARGTRGDIDEMDDEESYYKYMEENPLTTADDGSDVEIEYDEDGNPIPPPKKKIIDPLPPIDHSEIQYVPFEKNFYTPHEDIESLDQQQVEELKKNLGVKISGPDPPRPVSSFAHLGFDEQLMKSIRRSEYTQPTPVQAAGVPAALSGRDLIGIARTGSGKTAAFLWPLLVHIMDQKELAPGDGPIGLILAPTRELAQQIYMEAKKFGKVYNIRCVCCYGGGSKWEQTKALEGGAEIVVGTPGRVIDLVKCKATDLQRVTYLVLDEADRMFDMGFGIHSLEAEQTAANLGVQQYDALLLHGDMDQADRNKVITAFKRQESNILVATDVAARGLDIPHIRTVINYTVSRDIDTHTHRVGRTGRAGVRGNAYTLLARDKDKDFAGHLLRNLEGVQQEVPDELANLAMQSAWFRKSRFKKGKGKNLNIGGCGLGYKERPGLPAYNDEALAAISAPEKSGGPATNRLASLKQAFRSQYNQFTASSDHSWEQTRPTLAPGVNEPAGAEDQSGEDRPVEDRLGEDQSGEDRSAEDRRAERVRKSGKRSRWE